MSFLPGWNSAERAGAYSKGFTYSGFVALFLLGLFEVLAHVYSTRKERLLETQASQAKQASDEKLNSLKNQLRLTDAMYLVPVTHGVAAPDLSRGSKQRVLLTEDTTLSTPILPHMASDATVTWTLILDQDAKGEHTYTIPFLSYSFQTEPNTRVSMVLVTTSDGHTTMAGLPVITPIQK